MPALQGADYSHFNAKFTAETPDFLKAVGFEEETGIDLRRLMKDSFRFSSDAEPGLELVDVVTNATRRALQAHLGPEGWRHIPRLMIHRPDQYLRLVCLTPPSSRRLRPPYA